MDRHLFHEDKYTGSVLFRLYIVILMHKGYLYIRQCPHNHVMDLLYIQVSINILVDHSVYIVHLHHMEIDRMDLNIIITIS